ncbi:MAG: hypothetical protein L0Y57_10965 [Beijerinckiaceae bacterium]|nr:hypothetical protein [Beijerinckiaceae bacterium]
MPLSSGNRFVRSLEQTARYKIGGSRLALLNQAGAVIAQFEGVSPR